MKKKKLEKLFRIVEKIFFLKTLLNYQYCIFIHSIQIYVYIYKYKKIAFRKLSCFDKLKTSILITTNRVFITNIKADAFKVIGFYESKSRRR